MHDAIARSFFYTGSSISPVGCRRPHLGTPADAPAMGRGRVHADISLERGTLPRGRTAGPRPGNATSRQNAPPGMVTTIAVAVAALLLCSGALLGATCTARVLQPRLLRRANQHTKERRMLAEEWAALRQQRGECPRCTNPLPQRDTDFAPTLAQD